MIFTAQALIEEVKNLEGKFKDVQILSDNVIRSVSHISQCLVVDFTTTKMKEKEQMMMSVFQLSWHSQSDGKTRA